MSMSKRKGQAVPARNQVRFMREAVVPQPGKTMEDLPPEVLTLILEHVTLKKTKNIMLGYRLVNSQWKDIVDSLLEKEVISRRLKVFPAMKIDGQSSDQLSVVCPQSIFRTGRNPLSSNSLLLHGTYYFSEDPRDTLLTLPIFMSRFGGNLSTFALHCQSIGTKSLAVMLRSMENLKVLCFENVELTKRSIGPGGILQPPPMPNLTTLEFVAHSSYGEVNGIKNVLYIWLIASYADQLVRLKLETGDPLPALQQGHQYSTPNPLRRGEMVSISKTSDSAFGNLKELEIRRPSSQFLCLSETPSLIKLSLTGRSQVRCRDVAKLVDKCGSTLREVLLDIAMYYKDGIKYFLPGGLQPTAGVVARNVKSLAVSWSHDAGSALLAKNILPMFPGLEVLQLLQFGLQVDHEMSFYEFENDGDSQAGAEANESNSADLIISLKQRLASLCEQQEAMMRQNEAEMEDHRQDFLANRNERDALWRQAQARDRIVNHDQAFLAARMEKVVIYNRLAALGENVKKILAERSLEQQGVWNICTNLKIVSFRMPDGDSCFIRRMDNA